MAALKAIAVLAAICACSIDHVRPHPGLGFVGHQGIRPYFLDVPANKETLKLVVVVHRNADRTINVEETYPKDPNKNIQIGPKGRAQLTAIGKAQSYELGRYLRVRYDGFLNRIYSIDEVSAKSSDYDRTIMTAQTVLAGLFPPSYDDPEGRWNDNVNWQPIPVRTIDSKLDSILRQSASCPRYLEEDRAVEASDVFKTFDKKYEYFYNFLSKHSGWPIRNAHDVNELIDILIVQRAHGLRLPSWTDEPGFWISANEVQKTAYLEKGFSSTEKRLRAGPLITDVIANIERKRNETENYGKVKYPLAKMLLYSGSDNTVLSMLIGLGITDWELPPYVATIMLELHKYDSPQHHHDQHNRFAHPLAHADPYFVKLLYRNDTRTQIHELQVPGCGNPCKLSELEQLLAPIIITPEQWTLECQGTPPPLKFTPIGFGAYGK